jgi:hypothetical protein
MDPVDKITNLLNNLDMNTDPISDLIDEFNKLTIDDVTNAKTINKLTESFNDMSLYDIQLLESQFENLRIEESKIIIETKYNIPIVIHLFRSCHLDYNQVHTHFSPNWIF